MTTPPSPDDLRLRYARSYVVLRPTGQFTYHGQPLDEAREVELRDGDTLRAKSAGLYVDRDDGSWTIWPWHRVVRIDGGRPK